MPLVGIDLRAEERGLDPGKGSAVLVELTFLMLFSEVPGLDGGFVGVPFGTSICFLVFLACGTAVEATESWFSFKSVL